MFRPHPLAASAALALLSGCQAATPAPIAPQATVTPPPSATSETPASSAAAPAPAPGERPTQACAAKHSIVPLPLSAVLVDDWANAIASYRPEANGGRPVAWEGAESAVKGYLEAVHACVHAAFFDSFLASLAELPKTHPLADQDLATTVELVIDGDSGALEKSGVVASSGVPEFDAAALAAFARAFPLAAPPPESLSSDGRFYVTWEIHRRREEACSSAQARAWKLRF